MTPSILPAMRATSNRKMQGGLADKWNMDARYVKRTTLPGMAGRQSNMIYEARGYVVSFTVHTGLGARKNYGKNGSREKQVMAVIIRAMWNENGYPSTTNGRLTEISGQLK